MSRYKKLFITLFLTICLPLQALCQEQQKVLVKPIIIDFAEFFEKYNAVGQCKTENSRTYNAKVAGTVDSISIIQGKNIYTGNVLITIDKNLAEALKTEAQAAFQSAESTYNKDLLLLQKKIISEEALNKSKVTYERTKAELTRTINTYNNMVITAPFDGYVGVVRANVGDEVKIGDYLFSLIANGDKTIFVELPETLHGKIDETSDVSIFDLSNKKATGKVIATSDYLSDKGTITAKIIFSSSTNIVHGSYIETEIIYNKHKSLAIPEKTILKNENGNFVYKITEENLVKKVYITLGTTTNDMVELISNELKKDDMIVLEGLTKVQDNTAIELIKEQPEV